MSMKTILIPTEQNEGQSSALWTALLLARRFDSYIEGFALQSSIAEFVSVDMGGISLESYREEKLEEAMKIRVLFESFMQEHKVPRFSPATSGLSFGWVEDASEGEGTVGSYGRAFDIIVLSRPSATSTGLHNRALESGLFALFSCRRRSRRRKSRPTC